MNSLNISKKLSVINNAATPKPAPIEPLQCDFSLHPVYPIIKF